VKARPLPVSHSLRPPSISVLLPVYNAAATLERAARSVLSPPGPPRELVVIDDGSTDETGAVLKRLQAEDGRIQGATIAHQGQVTALNIGVSQCRAPVIARMDADDVSSPERLSRQFDFLQKENLDVVGGRVRIVDRLGKIAPTWRRYEAWVNDHLDSAAIAAYRFVESPLVHPTVMARREVLELGYREGPWPEDYDLWLRAMARGFRFAKIPEVVLDWTDGPGRLTRVDARYSSEAFDRCRRSHLRQGPLRERGIVDLWGAGQTGKPWLRWLIDEGMQVRHLYDVAPRKIGQSMHGVVVRSFQTLSHADGVPLLIAVGAEGARDQIRPVLAERDYVPGQNAWFVA